MVNRYCVAGTIATVCAVILSFVLLRCYSREFDKIVNWSKRKAAIKVMEVFYISRANRNGCLVKNIFMKAKRNTNDTCGMCENMDSFILYNATEDDIIVNDVTRDIHNEHPILVYNDTYWSDESEKLITGIAKEIGDLPSVLTYKQCQYQTNMKVRYSELPHLLNYIETDTRVPFYVFWENCAPLAIKEFRLFYKRPPFLGGNVQLTGSNWMLLCRDYMGKVYRQIELFSPLVIVMVQAGEVRVRLEAADDCEGLCVNLERTLRAGDTLMFSANIYSLFYKPVCDQSETIVIGVSGYVD